MLVAVTARITRPWAGRTRILWVIVFVGMIVIHIVCKELIFLVIDAAQRKRKQSGNSRRSLPGGRPAETFRIDRSRSEWFECTLASEDSTASRLDETSTAASRRPSSGRAHGCLHAEDT
jgi:hypothetical protein